MINHEIDKDLIALKLEKQSIEEQLNSLISEPFITADRTASSRFGILL